MERISWNGVELVNEMITLIIGKEKHYDNYTRLFVHK